MAKREIVSILSILILIASCEGLNEYDYLQVVIQWQPATCSDSRKPLCYQVPANKFSIHGMWPSLYNGYPTQCSGNRFDETQLSSLKPGVYEIWPNVATGDTRWLWEHEWMKHGTCSEVIFDQKGYFGFTMDTFIYYNLLFILGKSHITPNGQVYTKDQFYAAIRAKTGKRPALRCNYNRQTGVRQLHEITFCYKWDASLVEDCPSNANNCNGDFVWSS